MLKARVGHAEDGAVRQLPALQPKHRREVAGVEVAGTFFGAGMESRSQSVARICQTGYFQHVLREQEGKYLPILPKFLG